MIVAARLLKDLQAELGRMEADLGAKVTGDDEARGRLESEWRQAFDAQRTGASFEVWRDDRLTQVAVAWLLACVFVRFCEDNHLVDEAGIAGPGDRGAAARAAQQGWFATHPHDSDREYLHSVFGCDRRRRARYAPGSHPGDRAGQGRRPAGRPSGHEAAGADGRYPEVGRHRPARLPSAAAGAGGQGRRRVGARREHSGVDHLD